MCVFFYFKQKTAYEMRISDWSSDVCSSDLEAAHAMGTSKWKKQARIFKMILYGRYARGGADDDPGCKSDYDILIVVNDERLTDFECWSAAEDRLTREIEINQSLGAPVSFIVHKIGRAHV